jgi:tRNA(Arg) A34 adenosine deaminase TadA
MTALEELMGRCLELARSTTDSGNYPLGALVAVNGEIVAESGSNLIGDDNDPSAHPEMIVVREAAKKTGSRYLPGAVLVTTLEPCPMCTSVAIWAKMAGIAFGATQQDALAWSAEHPDDVFTWRQIEIPSRTVIAAGQPALTLHEGVLRDECRSLFRLTLRR